MGAGVSSSSSMEQIYNAFIQRVEDGSVKLPRNIREMYLPARQVRITPKGIYVENGRVVLELSFENSHLILPFKVTLKIDEVLS